MKTIYAIETNPTLDIGRQGENGVTQVLFPKFADFNEAHAIYKRQGDTGYTDITLLSFDDDYYVWTIGTFHTQKAGWGKVEVNYSNNGIKQKTITWDVRVHKSLEATSTPEGYVDGNAIHIDTGDRSINLLFDDEQFELNDGNELTLNTDNIQEKLTAGANITIDANNTISATDTTYTAGSRISISNNAISADSQVFVATYGSTPLGHILTAISNGCEVFAKKVNSGTTYWLQLDYYNTAQASFSGFIQGNNQVCWTVTGSTWTESTVPFQGKLTAGQNITIDENNVISATGGGGGATYTGGEGITVDNTNHTISMSHTMAFTSANIELVVQEEGGGYNAGTYWQTKGETLSDTLRLNEGEFVFTMGQTAEGYAAAVQLVTTDINDLTQYGWLDFYLESEAIQAMKITTGDDEVKIYTRSTAASQWELKETFDIEDKIVHYQGFFRNYSNVVLTSASGVMTDPVFPLPHDARMDVMFDTPGYATVGGKQFPLIDLTTQKQKAFDSDCISMSFNGENTYIYDFYRKGYSMLYWEEKTPVRFTVNLNPDRDDTTLKFGVYDCQYSEWFDPIELGSYNEAATGNVKIYSIRFEAEWNEDYHGFTPQWTACDINNHAVYSTPAVTGGYTGPLGVYCSMPGYVENLYDFAYGIDHTATGVYFLYETEPNSDYDLADTSRDILQVPTETNFTMFEGWGRGWGEFDNNHVLSNGYMVLGCEDVEHTAGTWTINIKNQYGEVEKTKSFSESEGHMVERIYMTRDVTGERAMMFISDETIEATDLYQMDRNTVAYLEIVYSQPVESMDDLFRYQWFSGTYEKINTVPIADSQTYGMIRFDDHTLGLNDYGQLELKDYDVFVAEYGTTTYQAVRDAVLAGKIAIVYRLETIPDNQGEVYICQYVGPHDCSFMYSDGNMFNETFTRVIKVDNENNWATYDRLENAPLQAGNNVTITKTLINNKYKNVISATDTTYTAGNNITISGTTISATDTTYTAGTGISITDGVISLNLPTITDQTTY